MPTPRTRLRLVLIQVRSHRASLLQEQSCFLERCGVARDQMRFLNVVDEPRIRWADVAEAHAVLIGGAGAYSVTEEHPFTAPLREVVERLVGDGRPVFGSCWGHQFLAAALGGRVVSDRSRSEVGTFSVQLTDAGRRDPLFAECPSELWVQLGHNDHVSRVAPGFTELARSDRSRNQVIRLADRPVYGTQFHSEMNEQRLRERLTVYLDRYVADEAELSRVLRGLRPSIDADRLLARFLELYA